jgi:hypothetical protein
VPLKTLLVWAQLLGLFGACHCAMALPLAGVDFGGMVTVGASRHLDNLQPLAAVTDDDTLRTVAAVDEFRQRGVQFVDRGLIQGVDIHKWSEPGRLSFVLSPKGSRTGPDTANAGGACTRSSVVVIGIHAGDATGGPGSCLSGLQVHVGAFHSGGGNRTHDLSVMSAPSCLCSTPHGYFVAPVPAHCQAEPRRKVNGGSPLCPS